MRRGLSILVLVLVAVGCAQPASRPSSSSEPATQARTGPTTLQTVMRVEPASLASKPLVTTGISVAHAVRLFNAELDQDDGQEVTRPYLVEALPALNTDSWKVFPDGRMETIYRLRPNLTWHDGTPLSAEDFVFAWRVYRTPELGPTATLPPVPQMDEALAPDDRTLVIRWLRPFPEAAAMGKDFQALPRHILEAPFQQLDSETFTNHPFWGTQYVGLGPYKLERWDPGASIQAVAFDGHALGRPKIDRIVVRFIADENTVLTNLLAGEVQFATDRTVRFEQAQTLKREWAATNGGTPILTPAQPRYLAVQYRPEFANPRALLDIRARRALAHAVDREALNLGLFDGEGAPTETMITPFFQAYQDVDRAITKYPFDPRRTEQLLNEVGYIKGADGTFAMGGERLALSFLQEAGNQTEREMSILIDTWRQVGIETRPTVMSSVQLRDYEIRATFPSVYSTAMGGAVKGGTKNLVNYTTPAMGTPANRWQGNNYSGWSNSEYDRLYQAFSSTLDSAERNRQVAQMAKLISDDVAFIMLFFNYNVSAHSSAVRGPDPKAFDTLVNWNIHEWEIR